MKKVCCRHVASALAVSLFLMLPKIAHAGAITLTFSFKNVVDPIGADYVGLYTTDATTSNFNFAGVAALRAIPVGDSSQSIIISPTALSQTLPANLNDTTPITGIAFLGVYNPTSSSPGLTIGVDSSVVANYLAKTYAEAFPASTISESDAVSGLLASNVNTVGNVPVIPSGENYGFAIGDLGAFVNFSTGTANGTFASALVPVPEPPTIALLGAALLCLGLIRRRRS